MVIALDVKSAPGKLIQIARPGQVLFPGTVIARLEIPNDINTSRPKNFYENFEQWKAANAKENEKKLRINLRFEKSLEKCKNILDGYSVPDKMLKNYIDEIINELFEILGNEKLPFCLYEVDLQVVKNRIGDSETLERIGELLKLDTFDAHEIQGTIDRYLDSLNPAEIGVEKAHFEKLQKTCEKFLNGLNGHKCLVISELLKTYLQYEGYFQDVSYDKAVSEIIADVNDPEKSSRIIFSHKKIESKNLFVEKIISRLDESMIENLKHYLIVLSNLSNPENDKLTIQIRKVLNEYNKYEPLKKECLEKKLELSRVPDGSVDITDESSQFSVYKFEDQGITRFFVRTVIRNIAQALKTDKYSNGR